VEVNLITPFGALFAVSALVPLAVFALRRRRLRAIRQSLGLDEPTLGSQLSFVVALAAVPVLLGVAGAQPVVETGRTVPERTDAQVFLVLDISRSMLASEGSGAPTRFERARTVALGLREELPEVPFGIASLTDRVLPHLFPTADGQAFAATLDRAIDIEQPPPGAFYLTFATNLNSLRSVPEKNYFPPSAKKRVLVVLTDGETQAVEGELARAFKRRPQIDTIFVHVWGADERIYEAGVAEGGYRPDARSGPALARAASLVDGEVVDEDAAGRLAGAVRSVVGQGETVARAHERRRFALMPYLTLAALVPLALVLLRRNVWWRAGDAAGFLGRVRTARGRRRAARADAGPGTPARLEEHVTRVRS
jgi:hypothetical protein